MLGFLQRIIPDGLKRAIALKVARWAAGVVSGILLGVLVNKLHLAPDVAAKISADLQEFIIDGGTAAILGGMALIFSVKDAKKVDAQVKQASVSALPAGTVVQLPSGDQVTVGQPSPAQSSMEERAETAALNKAETGRAP